MACGVQQLLQRAVQPVAAARQTFAGLAEAAAADRGARTAAASSGHMILLLRNRVVRAVSRRKEKSSSRCSSRCSRVFMRASARLTGRRLSRCRACSSWNRAARSSRCSSVARCSAILCCASVISSAAAEGVGARRSATKSAMVKSVSCPIAETTGSREAAMARATRSLLKAARSSSDPPPRASTIRSTRAGSQGAFSWAIAASISAGA